MTRAQAITAILEAKQSKGVSWKEIAKAVGKSPVWTTSALLGQNSMSAEQAQKACAFLGLGKEVETCLGQYPLKGSLQTSAPVDPLIYRFHEITQVYGTTIKELIHEEFGDGIMSAIDFEMEIKRQPDPKGDRVVITFNGKFLPYRQW
jgi:cyanate lyase